MSNSSPFDDLAWEDLSAWAGERVVKRGKSYLRSVEDARLVGDGSLLAWVEGSDRYATLVRRSSDGRLASRCTCPYGVSCKHAVATVLSYLESRKQEQDVPAAEPDDERLVLLADEAEWSDDEDEEETDGANGGKCEAAGASANRREPDRKETRQDPSARLETHLAGLSRPALLALVRQLCGEIPDVRRRILESMELAQADVAGLVRSTRAAIQTAARKPGWTRHWSNERYIPDYRPVRDRLKRLLDARAFDEVMSLGDELLQLGMRQVGMSDDEGETGQEVASCMELVYQALPESAMSDADRLLWDNRVRRRDDCGFFGSIQGLWQYGERFPPTVWSTVADALAHELGPRPAAPSNRREENSSAIYRRQGILKPLCTALERAGRADEVIPLLEREVEYTHDYAEIVDRLIAMGRRADAAGWCRRGIAETPETLAGVRERLRDRLRALATEDADWPFVASLDADAFFGRPHLDSYDVLRESASRIGAWGEVRAAVLRWLEDGLRPDVPAVEPPLRRSGKRKAGEIDRPQPLPWPLPETGLPRKPLEGFGYGGFPRLDLLVELALHEGRLDDALDLHAKMSTTSRLPSYGYHYYGNDLDLRLADAVCATHPDRAVEIWHRTVLACVDTVNQASYGLAAGLLAKMKEPMARLGRESDWRAVIAGIRATQRRKRNLMKELDAVEGIVRPTLTRRILEQ